jgi:ABC-2 type transport system permease protein
MLFKVIWNEIKKEVLTIWSYRLQWIGEFLSLSFFFIFLISLTQEKQIAGLAYCLWFYAILIIGDISGKISTEMRIGTFEQIYLSVIPIPILLFAKVISAVVKSFIIMGSLFIILCNLGFINLHNLPVLKIILIIFIITPGLFGLSLFLGGLTILLKDVSWTINVINNGMLYLSGVFFPLDSLPLWLQYISQASLITTSLEFIKFSSYSNASFSFLLSLFYFFLGSSVFILCEKKAKIKGSLGHY